MPTTPPTHVQDGDHVDVTARTMSPAADAVAAQADGPAWSRLWPHLALAAVAIIAGVLDFWDLSINGWGNPYYAAAVRSMTENWHAFRYASLDPTGLITVDKPPLAFWIQAASARLFGFSSLSVLGPSALAGAVAVAVLGRTVTRLFGVWAGLVAAVTLALTPVALVANRSNNTDAILVLLVVLGTWAGVRAVESGCWRWVALATVLFGLGFLTKMLAAFLVLPGIVLAYLVLGPRKLPVRLAQLLAAGAILSAITFGWLLSVDLTPASARPWVGSTTTNSEINLAFGWNGLQRIFGLSGGSAGGKGGQVVLITEVNGHRVIRHIGAGAGSIGAAAGAGFGGPAGVTRLLTGTLAAQGSWLLPLALVGLVSALAAVGWRRRSVRLAGLIVFGGWSGVVWAVFSFAHGVVHPYYISELAPGVAALVGIGVVALWRDVLSRGRQALLPAVAIAGTGLFEWSILRSEHALDGWGGALAAIGVALALVLLAWPLAARRSGRLRRRGVAIATTGVGLGLAVLLVAPAAYAEGVITTVANGQIPIAQAPGAGTKTPPQVVGYDARALLAFAERHAGHDKYLLATEGALAWNLIIASGKNIVPLGGFGTALTAKELAGWVEKGEIRYFLLPPANGALGGASGLTASVTRICTPVPAREWGGGSGLVGPGGTNETLYDCAGKGGRLMAAANSTHKRLRLPTHK